MGDKRVQMVVLLAILALVFGGGVKYAAWRAAPEPAASPLILPPAGAATDLAGAGTASGAEAKPPAIYVHVSGAVASPGVYSLAAGARVVDAVELAGPLPEADIQALNLAAPLIDGQKIVVPRAGEAPAGTGVSGPGLGGPVAPGLAGGGQLAFPGTGSKVNINTASQAELETLPGIGPSLAQRIIDYRTRNGPFRAPEDLKNVSGIGDKRFEQLKDLITVY